MAFIYLKSWHQDGESTIPSVRFISQRRNNESGPDKEAASMLDIIICVHVQKILLFSNYPRTAIFSNKKSWRCEIYGVYGKEFFTTFPVVKNSIVIPFSLSHNKCFFADLLRLLFEIAGDEHRVNSKSLHKSQKITFFSLAGGKAGFNTF